MCILDKSPAPWSLKLYLMRPARVPFADADSKSEDLYLVFEKPTILAYRNAPGARILKYHRLLHGRSHIEMGMNAFSN
ncbi:MAG: hypothetical protein ABSE57_31455 [Bryobacteraceae bacterium]